VSGLFGSVAVAGRFLLLGLRRRADLAGAVAANTVPLCQLPTPDIGHGGHDIPRCPDPVDHLIPRNVGRQQPENGRECAGPSASLWSGEIRNGLDLVAQIASCDGVPGPGSTEGYRRS
jgi:hypothetical protein